MAVNKLDDFRFQLDDMSGRVREDVEALTEGRKPNGQGTGDTSTVNFDSGDLASHEVLHDLNATLLINERYLASEIHSAQQRLDEGQYGICERCHKTIPDERLTAVPYARYCVSCAERLEGAHR